MNKVFLLDIDKVQPSQLYINSEKLNRVREQFEPGKPENLEPIPVKRLGSEIIFTDGHTRALVAYLSGFKELRVYWDEDDLDWAAYEKCVQWCKEEGIRTIRDLKDRVVGPADYETLWLERCHRMQQELIAKRHRDDMKAERTLDSQD